MTVLHIPTNMVDMFDGNDDSCANDDIISFTFHIKTNRIGCKYKSTRNELCSDCNCVFVKKMTHVTLIDPVM